MYYGFEDDPRVFIGDIHGDGRYLYPGTGFRDETGKEKAKGTKLNIPLAPGAGDSAFFEAFNSVLKFVKRSAPEFIFLQCGADGLDGDPLTHLRYSYRAHEYATKELHRLSHEICGDKILAMGGGGYNPANIRDAWIAVTNSLSSSD